MAKPKEKPKQTLIQMYAEKQTLAESSVEEVSDATSTTVAENVERTSDAPQTNEELEVLTEPEPTTRPVVEVKTDSLSVSSSKSASQEEGEEFPLKQTSMRIGADYLLALRLIKINSNLNIADIFRNAIEEKYPTYLEQSREAIRSGLACL